MSWVEVRNEHGLVIPFVYMKNPVSQYFVDNVIII